VFVISEGTVVAAPIGDSDEVHKTGVTDFTGGARSRTLGRPIDCLHLKRDRNLIRLATTRDEFPLSLAQGGRTSGT
jgi:hypothetical protein